MNDRTIISDKAPGDSAAAFTAELREDGEAFRAKLREDGEAFRAALREDGEAFRAEFREEVNRFIEDMDRRFKTLYIIYAVGWTSVMTGLIGLFIRG